MWKQFKEFAFKGNIFDLAIGVVIGAAFSTIVSSLVDDIITPIIGVLSGGLDFSGLSYKFLDAEIKFGLFLQAVFKFFIIAVALFFFMRLLMKMKIAPAESEEKEPEEKALDTKEELLTEIRDLLKESR